MDTVIPGSNGRVSRKKLIKITAICLAVLLAAGAVFAIVRARSGKAGGAAAQRTARVTRGDLVKSITGSAPIVSSNRSELSPKVTATLKQINCKEGDQVKKGDVLFVLDNTDALLDIENTKNSIAQLQLTMESTEKSIKGLTVTAPYSGRITEINVKAGDNVNKGGAILTITDISKLNVTLPFSGKSAKNIKTGQKADVYLPDLMQSVEGIVTYKSSKPYSTPLGGELYDVEITIENPGSLSEGMTATAEISVDGVLLNSVESGTLSFVNKDILKSDAGGTVVSLNVRENEFVSAGDVLAKLENEDLLLTLSTNNIKMENLKSQLEIQQKQLEYYTIVAPFDGTITSMGSANEGDTVKQGEVLAVVSDMNSLEFSISVDELDISQIAVGQEVRITAEALEETQTEPLAGKVSKIAMEGTSQNGVTTYPVTVIVDDNAGGKLKTGMNIDAEIIIHNKHDVLMVPLEAVTKIGDKSFVYVKSSGISSGASASGRRTGMSDGQTRPADTREWPADRTSAGDIGSRTSAGAISGETAKRAGRANTDPYYDGAVLVEVKTGISNDTYIEIISGLSEGQEVVLPKTATTTTANTNIANSSRREPGGMPGGGVQFGGVRGF